MLPRCKKQLMGLLQPRKLSESRCFNVPLLYLKKIESHLESKSSDAQQINLRIVPQSFVANYVSCISAKYYLNWFSFRIVIMKVIGVYTI